MKRMKAILLRNQVMTLLMVCSMMVMATSCSDDDDDDDVTLAAPVPNNATNVTVNSFTVTWPAVPGAEKYLLDVSTSNTFATTLAGYNKKEIAGALTTNVTNLTAGTQYYFRLYAKKGSTLSPPSAVKNVTTAAN